jgi:glycosyltransferase involved in cell wall biosynthesis
MTTRSTFQPQGSKRMRVLTWHVHGNYLYYLTQAPHDFYLPVKPGKPEGYGGRAGTLLWGENVFELDAGEVRNCDFDIILYQSHKNYLEDRLEILSEPQRQQAQIYLEHDPPREHPTDTKHPVDDPNMLIVHVTQFNKLMWDNNRTPAVVIEHGVVVPEDVRFEGELARGISVVNNIARRGRRTGADVFEYAREKAALDLVGMNSTDIGGLGEVPFNQLLEFEAHYRFFFNPIRYTSLGLAVCEAMMIGMPVIGLATTEMSAVIQNGYNGYVDTDLDQLVGYMHELIDNAEKAKKIGAGAREYARQHFNIQRFSHDWDRVFQQMA